MKRFILVLLIMLTHTSKAQETKTTFKKLNNGGNFNFLINKKKVGNYCKNGFMNNDLLVFYTTKKQLYICRDFKNKEDNKEYVAEKATINTTNGFWFKTKNGGVHVYNKDGVYIKKSTVYKYDTNEIDVVYRGELEKNTFLLEHFKNVVPYKLNPVKLHEDTFKTEELIKKLNSFTFKETTNSDNAKVKGFFKNELPDGPVKILHEDSSEEFSNYSGSYTTTKSPIFKEFSNGDFQFIDKKKDQKVTYSKQKKELQILNLTNNQTTIVPFKNQVGCLIGYDCENGIGAYKYKNDAIYIGSFKNNKRDGFGKLSFKSGQTYLGEFLENKKNGVGSFIYGNGDYYFGEWKDDGLHGLGSYYFKSSTVQSGIWDKGVFIKSLAKNNNNYVANKSKKEADIVKVDTKNVENDKKTIEFKDLNTLFDIAAKAVKNKNIPNLKSAANTLIKEAPENYAGYLYLAFVNCLENDVISAKKNARTSLNLNYIDASNFAILSFISFLEGNLEASKKQMDFSYALISYPDALNITLDDINWIEKETGKDCSQLKEFAKNANSNSANSMTKAKKIFTAMSEWQKGENYKSENEVYAYLSSNAYYGKPALAAFKFIKGVLFYNKNKYQEAISIINNFTNNETVKNNINLQYPLAQAYNYLADNSYYSSDYQSMLNEANNGIQVVKKINTNFLYLDLLNNKLKAVTGLNNKTKIYQTANDLLREAIKNKNEYFEAIANNSLGNYYVNSVLSSDRNKAFTYNQKAYNLAVKIDNKNLISNISGNYSISLWQKNQKQKAKEVALKAMSVREELNDIEGAQLLANNMGYMYYISKDYSNASKMFLKAINLSEKHLENSSPEIQLALMNEYTSAYSGLIMTYKDTRNTAELFKIQDANRSRLLSKKLHQKAFGKKITDVQNQLTNDDVLVYYSLLSPGEMVATIITKNNATIKYNFPIDSWLKLKKRFVNFVKKKPNTINNHLIKIDEDVIDGQLIKYKDKKQAFSADDFNTFTSLTRQLMEKNDKKNAPYLDLFLKQWYSFLIAPIANDILGKKNLIISGEEELHYLPFEAFKSSNNQYLLEKYNVTYIPSVTVWSKLKERKYAASRKSLLAFGGATYYPPGGKEGKTRTKKDFYTIKKELTNKIKTNKKNLSNELTAFGFGGAAYLPGTLREVNNLKKIVLNAKVLTGNSMTESSLKKMNATGELSNYKWVHIATHGFASDNIPSLSGVMMTQNESEKNKGEDTFLLAHEIEKLNLKADMVVLSACETALGKIYGGEGINGLNSSLLVAGANNTLLSLWPVNDAGTMVLMTLMYENMYLKNQTASIALTNAKRTMLKGEIGEGFKSVSMWGPFILNGSGE